ncbi:hypothetical protein ACFVSW_00400 [Neobacillus sp. NPDC058068]
MESVSHYVVQKGPCPVLIVKYFIIKCF